MIDEIKNNIDAELKMVREAINFLDQMDHTPFDQRRLLEEAVDSISSRIKILNTSVGSLAKATSLVQKLPGKETNTGVEKVAYQKNEEVIAVRSQDKERYLRELSITQNLLSKMKKKSLIKPELVEEYKRPNLYGKFANKLFLTYSNKLIKKGYFQSVNSNLRKANINILTSTYVSITFLTTALSVLLGVFLFIFFMLFSLGMEAPFLSRAASSGFLRFVQVFWIVLAVPVLTFGSLYYYPQAERRSIARKIESELPFVVIHMGSISGSGVEPTQIFKIVGLSKEYTSTRKEIRKLMNQINVYGYDLVTALQNIARLTPSPRFSEVLSGLSTTISSGGDLKTFFEKRAETLLLNYRLERERFTKVAETFMDIYISVVIATPMILLLLLVMISVSGVQIGFTLNQLTFIIIFTVATINVIFLWVLSMRQPAY